MKISKIFHFLYFSVLSIPLISMPIFAIYSQNHEITGYEVTQEVNKSINFNQYVNDGNFVDNSKWVTYSGTSTIENNSLYLQNAVGRNGVRYDRSSLVIVNHTYIARMTAKAELVNFSVNVTYPNVATMYFYPNENEITKCIKFTYTGYSTNGQVNFDTFPTTPTEIGNITISNVMIFDLTQMGLEDITIEKFNEVFNNTYYPYTESQDVIIENYETLTYNDTDIMSQFIYNEYNFMDKYLGIYKFSPFNDIYQWLQNIFFGGAAPMVFTIFYQWFAYWLFVSLCWLIFDVLMYVPLMIHRWLDKAEL